MAQDSGNAPLVAQEFTLDALDRGSFRPEAMRLAEQTMPVDVFTLMFEHSVRNGLQLGAEEPGDSSENLSPEIAADLEKEMLAAVRPHVARIHRQTLHRFARLYSMHFTDPEIAELSAFYASPLGRKIVAVKYAHMSSADALRGMSLEQQTTEDDINRINRDATAKVMQRLEKDDYAAILQLMAKPVFQKMRTLKPIVDKVEAMSANEEDPELDAAIDAAVRKVMDKHQLTG